MQGAAAAAAVLDDDDLLGEILLRVAFPTSLVRVALVCKRWLRLASAPAFLRRFRDLHPPSLLGFYVMTHINPPRFVPMPQPPELASVVRRASFDLDTMGIHRYRLDVDYCSNGLLLITNHGTLASCKRRTHRPLYPTRHVTFFPPIPTTSTHDGFARYDHAILPKGGGRNGSSYLCLAICCKELQAVLDVYVLRDNIWAIHSSVATEFISLLLPSCLIADDMVYNLVRVRDTFKLLSLDLSSSSLSLANLPEEVEELLGADLVLENDSEVHLIYVKGSQLRIWLYMVDSNSLANWLLVSTTCLQEICANHMIPTSVFEDTGDASDLFVYAAGANSGLLFLQKDEVLYLFDIRHKTVKKVFETTREDIGLHEVRPFMMVWPPNFPVMKEECDPKE